MNKTEVDPVHQMQIQHDYSSEEDDLKPLIIKRRRSAASSPPKKILDVASEEEDDLQPLTIKRRRCAAYSPKKIVDIGYCTNGMNEQFQENDLQMLEGEGFLLSDDSDFSDTDLFNASNDIELIFCDLCWNDDDPDDDPGGDSEPQICRIVVNGESHVKSDFIKLLKEIDCENRFVVRSVECSSVFFAGLNKEEIEKLKGVEGIRDVSIFQPNAFVYW